MKRIAILGGGPSGLFMFKHLLESGKTDLEISIFERKKKLGVGMPYSPEGANDEHITNVSGNEIPMLVTSLNEWVQSVPKDTLDKFHIDPDRFNEYRVLPRLLFGQYLSAQFNLLQKQAREQGVDHQVYYDAQVTDLIDHPDLETVSVEINGQEKIEFDCAIICIGHNWPKRHEGSVPYYFDSPYPPVKLALKLDHPIAIKGSSLTAVDAIRTLSRYNGAFEKDANGKLVYQVYPHSANFKLILHTRNGLLPAVRFHLDDPHLCNDRLLTSAEVVEHIAENDGFLSLDYIFEHDFKAPIKAKQPEFYARIKDLNLEEFVDAMMALRDSLDPFQLLKAEYAEAEQSIRRRESVYWKEMLGVLSFALNYPAKYLSAEDMQRLKKSLSPLIAIVIAYIPQSSSEELLAMHQAGVLDLISVGADSRVEAVSEGGATYHYTDENGQAKSVYFNTYVDCVGQPHMSYADFPFKSLLKNQTVSPAKLKFRSAAEGEKALQAGEIVTQDDQGTYYLTVPGIAINDHFQVVDTYGAFNERIYIMAVPYIGGYNPDYSGLDFSEAAAAAIAKRLFS